MAEQQMVCEECGKWFMGDGTADACPACAAVRQVEQLKAARRAELKAAADARAAKEQERAREADRLFRVALGYWLAEVGAGWLSEFHTATESACDSERTAVFAVPGHAPIRVNFSGDSRGWSPIAYQSRWQAAGELYARLDDALIAAEAQHARDAVPL